MSYPVIHPSPAIDRLAPASGSAASDLSVARHRMLGGLEIVLITLGYLAVVWLIAPDLETNGLIPFMKLLLVFFFFYLAFLSPALVHQFPAAERGLGRWTTLFIRTDNLTGAAKYYFLLALAGTAAVVAAAWWHRPAIFSDIDWQALWLKLALNLPNALGQDLLFLAFFIPRLKMIFPRTAQSYTGCGSGSHRHCLKVSLACAFLFAIYHTPNLPLMLLVFFLGLAVTHLYYHLPNLALAVLTHAVIGTALHRVLEMHMRVGPFYWESDRYVYRTLFPTLRELIGSAF